MLALYLFLLVVGGGFALLSLAGDALDGGEMELDSSLEGGVRWWDALSLQSFVYAAFGAGGTGTVLHLLWDGAQPLVTALLAAGTGATSGVIATFLLTYLKRSSSGESRGESSFEGLPATVTLPVRGATPGRIRVRRGSRDFVLRALPYGAGAGEAPETWTQVVVVEVREGVAYVTPAGPELSGSEPGLLPG